MIETLSDVEKNNKRISFAVCTQVTLIGIKNMFVHATTLVYENNTVINMILLSIVAVFYLYAIVRDKKALKINRVVFSIVIFILCTFLLTMVFCPENIPYIVSYLPRMLPYCFLTWFLITKLTSLKWIEWYMQKYATVIIGLSIVAAVLIYQQGHITISENITYSMSLSYVAMIGVMWCLKSYFETEKINMLFFSVAGTIVIVMYGARNPLLAIAIYVIISIVRKGIKKNNGVKIVKYWCFGAVGLMIVFFFEQFLSLISDILKNFGLSSRTIELLMASELSTSGRDVIHSSLIEVMNQNPLLGLGVCGDEVALSMLGMTQSAHSLYLSIFATYGYVLGVLVLAILIGLNVSAYKRADKNEKEILLIYMCMVWPRGFVGGSIWDNDFFWWMFGMILVIFKRRAIDIRIRER